MAGYNERKLQILEYIRRYGEVTASDVADDLDLEIHNARTLLKKYHRLGLLTRRTSTNGYRTRIYNITERGLQRIKWIRKSLNEYDLIEVQEGIDGEEDNTELEDEGPLDDALKFIERWLKLTG